MAETAEALLAMVETVFRRKARSVKLKAATYEAANEYAQKLGKCLSDAFRTVLKEDVLPDGHLYRATADIVVRPMLEEAYRSVAQAAKTAQNAVNKAAGVGLKAIEPMTTAEKARNITYVVANACRSNNYSSEMSALTLETQQFSRKVVDSSAQKNAEFQRRSGMQVLVSRDYDDVGVHDGKDVCEWCLARCGTDVPYEEAYNKGMFERHPGCGCVITYRSAKGTFTQGAGQWQNNTWTELDAAAREERISFSERADAYRASGDHNDWSGTRGKKPDRQTLAELTGYVESKGFRVGDISKFDGDPDLFKTQVDALASMREQYGALMKSDIKVSSDVLKSDDDFAAVIGNMDHVVFNTKALRDREITERNIRSRKGWFSFDDFEGIARHESGHLIEGKIGKKGFAIAKQAYYNINHEDTSDDDFIDWLEDNVSHYSTFYHGDESDDRARRRYSTRKHGEITSEIVASSKQGAFEKEFIRLLRNSR